MAQDAIIKIIMPYTVLHELLCVTQVYYKPEELLRQLKADNVFVPQPCSVITHTEGEWKGVYK